MKKAKNITVDIRIEVPERVVEKAIKRSLRRVSSSMGKCPKPRYHWIKNTAGGKKKRIKFE